MIVAVHIARYDGAVPLIVAYALRQHPQLLSYPQSKIRGFSVLGLEPNLGLFVLLFRSSAALVALSWSSALNNRTFKMTVNGTRSIRWSRFFVSGLIWLILSVGYLFIYLKVDPSNFALNNTSVTLIGLIVISVVFIPFQAAFEEVIFRGYLMQGFSVLAGNRWIPLMLTSLLFGIMHSFAGS
jgi:membrane protease YdiL (CAAX protease family)